MDYKSLQQRRERIELALSHWDEVALPGNSEIMSCIRALLDDADCGERPLADLAPGSPVWLVAVERYDRELSIAEKELGL